MFLDQKFLFSVGVSSTFYLFAGGLIEKIPASFYPTHYQFMQYPQVVDVYLELEIMQKYVNNYCSEPECGKLFWAKRPDRPSPKLMCYCVAKNELPIVMS